jgi:hypothetical protein
MPSEAESKDVTTEVNRTLFMRLSLLEDGENQRRFLAFG